MAEMTGQLYSLDEDSIQRLTKDLNYMFQHLDEKNVRRLYTEYCEISSKDGETEIDGPLLLMRAKGSSNIRLKAGWDTPSSEFVFNLYNSTGGLTMSLNSTGNAVFSGNLNTSQDVFIGNRLFLGWNASTKLPAANLSTRGMYIMEPGTTKYMAAIYSTDISGIIGTTYPVYEFEIESSNTFNITSKEKMRLYMYAGYDGVSTATINTTDRLNISAFNGLMFINTEHGEHSTASRGLYLGEDNHSVYLGSYETYYNQVAAVKDMPQDYRESEFRYYYSHNVRFIASPTTNWVPSNSSNTIFDGSTYVMTSTRGTWFSIGTTVVDTYAYLTGTFANKDLTQSPDGTAFTTDDYLVFVFWANSTNVNVTHGVYIQLGNDASNYYRYYLTSTNGDDWTPGWNVIQRKLGDYESILGAPAFNNIEWARVGYRGLGDTTVVVIMDYMGLIRAHPTVATTYSIYQRTVASTHELMHNQVYGDVMLEHNGGPVICQLPINTYVENNMYLRSEVQDFDVELQYFALSGNNAPAMTAFFDSDNYVDCIMSSGKLRTRGKLSGSTIGDYIDCAAFSQFEDARIGFKRQANKFTGYFRLEGDAETYREVTLYNGPSTRLDFCSLFYGNSTWDVGARIKTITYKKYFEY